MEFPKMLHHPELDSVIVKNPIEEAALIAKTDDKWGHKPHPKAPKPSVGAKPTYEQLEEEFKKLLAAYESRGKQIFEMHEDLSIKVKRIAELETPVPEKAPAVQPTEDVDWDAPVSPVKSVATAAKKR